MNAATYYTHGGPMLWHGSLDWYFAVFQTVVLNPWLRPSHLGIPFTGWSDQ